MRLPCVFAERMDEQRITLRPLHHQGRTLSTSSREGTSWQSGDVGDCRRSLNGAAVPFIPSFVALVQQGSALPARHRSSVVRGDAFHLGTVSGLPVARITV